MRNAIFLTLLLGMIVSIATSQEKQTKVLISTEYGDMTAILYNETPKHRDNFIKLVKEGWYENSPFHRVINNFMIQGGKMPMAALIRATRYLLSFYLNSTIKKAHLLLPVSPTR